MSGQAEDIIRETFSSLAKAIGVQIDIPDEMIANLAARLQAQIDLLAELQSTGRLLADDEQRLTAEQVEDVRALVWLDGRRNFDAFYRLRALFPATEPAEAIDDVDDSRAQDIARAWIEAALDAGMDEMRWEIDEKGGEVFESAKKAILAALFKFSLDASSPVVPAPTETEWPSLDAVPSHVRQVWDKCGVEYRVRVNGRWRIRRPGGEWAEITIPPASFDDYAPFTAHHPTGDEQR